MMWRHAALRVWAPPDRFTTKRTEEQIQVGCRKLHARLNWLQPRTAHLEDLSISWHVRAHLLSFSEIAHPRLMLII